MKKQLLVSAILCVCFCVCFNTIANAAARPNSKKGMYFVQGLAGGATGDLDTLDITGASTPNQYDLIDGDSAIVATISGTTVTYYFYIFDADGTDAESSPAVIRPDDYASAGVWRLSRMSLSMIQNAVADGATKGVASFNADHFDASSGIISLDTTNGPFLANLVEDTTPQLGGTLDPNGNAITGYLPSIDEDDMASDSASYVPTQQSVKAYADTKESGTSNDIDPDRFNGDDTDDDLVDQDIIEGFAASASPGFTAMDSDSPGTDKTAGFIGWQYVNGADGSENSDLILQIMQAGTLTTIFTFDESDDQWETTKNIVVPTEAYDATNWNGDLTVPTKDAVRDKIETISGGGISNVVEDTTPQLGGNLDLNGNVITGLEIGTNVQAYDADLTTWAGVTPGTGVATALAVNIGSAGAAVVNGGALGTPSGGTLTNATGLPIASGVSGLGSNVATFLATPSSANLALAVTGETGSGAAVFATSPSLVTPALGTPASGVLTNCTGLPTAGLVNDAVTMDKLDDDGDFTSLTGDWLTTGTMQGRIIVTDDGTNNTVAKAEMNGIIYDNDGDTWVLDDIDAADGTGWAVCFYGSSANAITVDPNAEDMIRDTMDDGGLESAGEEIVSGGVAGDMICLVVTDFSGDVAHWSVTSEHGTWTPTD
jgi:hypothetical protein